MNTQITFLIVLAIVVAYLIGKSRGGKNDGHNKSVGDSAPDVDLERVRSQWKVILAEDRDLAPDEQQKYINFLAIENAVRISTLRGDGSRYSPSDLLAGIDECDAHTKKAKQMEPEVTKMLNSWYEEQQLLGSSHGSCRVPALEAAAKYDAALVAAGQVNAYRTLREWLAENGA